MLHERRGGQVRGAMDKVVVTKEKDELVMPEPNIDTAASRSEPDCSVFDRSYEGLKGLCDRTPDEEGSVVATSSRKHET